ncbi:MAG: alpha amylase C-terminal domain-containing protein [Candidatus Gastranaerophilales bacterium]|nr:alpha amylase C-terminal domain-containing protein [Candidatus Gastranaerophilales bacterium]
MNISVLELSQDKFLPNKKISVLKKNQSKNADKTIFFLPENKPSFDLNKLNIHQISPSTLSFGKKTEEHRSWGANILSSSEDGSQMLKFKLWAPYIDKVVVELRNPVDIVELDKKTAKEKNLRQTDDWATKWHIDAKAEDEKSKFVEMQPVDGNGTFQAVIKVPYQNAMYRYILKDKDNNTICSVKDPFSKAQKHIFSWSQVYNNDEFKWSDNNWVKGQDHRKVSNLSVFDKATLNAFKLSDIAGDNHKFLSPYNLIAKQINIPTATEEGSIKSLIFEIDKIKKEGIFNSILLMPVEGTYDSNWGYDGVDKYSVTRYIGGKNKDDAIKRTNDLKELVNHCHKLGINVGLDIVPSHMFLSGPTLNDAEELNITNSEELSGNSIVKLGRYDIPGQWGGICFNTEDKDINVRSKVRDFVVNMPLYWTDNFHMDFLRFDQTPEMKSNFTMKQIAEELRYHSPHTVIHWEDHRVEDGLTRPLEGNELCYNSLDDHCESIKKLEENNASLYNIGGNEHWDFAFSHALEANLINKEVMGYSPIMTTLANSFKDIGGTKYMMSHDEIGNDIGRLIIKIMCIDLNVFDRSEHQIIGSKERQQILDGVHALTEVYLFEPQKFEEDYSEMLKKAGLKNIKKDEFAQVVDKAVSKHKLGLGAVFMAPGSKMIHQGDEYGEINPFKFFRKQAYDEPFLDREKGYSIQGAINESKLDPQIHKIRGILDFTRDLRDLTKRNNSLKTPHLMEKLDEMTFHIDDYSKVLGIKRFNTGENQVIAYMNFSNNAYKDYQTFSPLPNGIWIESVNSNDEKYGGNGVYVNHNNEIASDGKTCPKIDLPPNSIVIFEQLKD